MSKIVKIIIGLVVVVIILIAISGGRNTESGPIKIGFIAPLSGGAASYGEPVKKGVEMAVSEINDNGGIKGRQLEVIYEDGKCDNKDATSAAQKLISIDKVKVIIGMICSGELLSAAPVAETAKVVLLGQGSSPEITNAGDYIFRSFPSDTVVGKALVENMTKNKVKTVAMLSGSTAYTLGLQKDFEGRIKDSDIKLVASENYTDTTKDFRSILQKIKLTNPDVLILNTQTPADGGRAAQQARDLGITSQFYTAYFSGPEFVGLGKAVEGTYVVDAPSLAADNQRANDFLIKSKEKYGTEVTYPFFSANAYDQVYLLAQIFADFGTNDSDMIKTALYNTKDFNGVTGNFGFDSNGDVTGIGMRMTQIKDGKLVQVQ